MQSRSRIAESIDGVLLIDKPVGPSTNAVLQQGKRLVGAAKAGHGGTLDPLASGLVVVLLGEATKFSAYQLEAVKAYAATACLGAETTTGDAEGERLEAHPVTCTDAQIEAALSGLRGEIEQVPPMYSALKQGGKPLYVLARKGIEVPRQPRRVRIDRFQLLRRHGASGELLDLEIRCSKGTYVRSLIRDLGISLGTGAHLQALCRTASGSFELGQAVTLDVLQALPAAERRERLLPLDQLLAGLPMAVLSADETTRLRHGQRVPAPAGVAPGLVRAVGVGGALIGVAEADANGSLRAVRLLRADPDHATG